MEEGYLGLLRRALNNKTEMFEGVTEDAIEAVLVTLTPRQRYVLRLRYGIGCGAMTLNAIGLEFKRHKDTIRQIEVKALRRLRHPMRLRRIYGETPAPEAEVTAETIVGSVRFNTILKERVVDRYDLTKRSKNCMDNARIVYIGDLIQKTEREMLKVKNFGHKSLKEIKEFLAEDNLHLGTRLDNWSPVD